MANPWVVFDCCSISIYGKTRLYRALTLILTFWAYTTYHLSRKPISIVKSVLKGGYDNQTNITTEGWAPFNGTNSDMLLGTLDYSYLFAYAIGMFLSGHIAERMNLRYYLTAGMLLSGIFTASFGFGYYMNIHSLAYYIVVQIITGFVEATGWPSVVTCVANWFGKGKRGFIMGVWNSHTSVGNILGALVSGVWVNDDWGLSFIVPGALIAGMGIIIFFFLVPKPSDIGCIEPDHYGAADVCFFDDCQDPSPDMELSVDRKMDRGYITDELEGFHPGDGVTESAPLVNVDDEDKEEQQPISFMGALKIPGVIEFSLCLFFAKLVSYTFLFWLPNYIKYTTIFDAEKSADLSTMFDVGGIVGGISAGLMSDILGARATVCAVMLTGAAPMMFVYDTYGADSLKTSIGLLFFTGALVNGPYALITTAVSADLGTHPSLHGNAKALATVTAIIDGTGSIGAAIGPLLTGLIEPTGWENVFWMLIGANCCALLLLSRLVFKEIRDWTRRCCSSREEDADLERS